MFENIETAGLEHLLKIAKSVDWNEVDKLNDEILISLGIECVDKETFPHGLKESYDLYQESIAAPITQYSYNHS